MIVAAVRSKVVAEKEAGWRLEAVESILDDGKPQGETKGKRFKQTSRYESDLSPDPHITPTLRMTPGRLRARFVWIPLMKQAQKARGINIISRFPRVVFRGVTLPLDKVLKLRPVQSGI